ncbi:MAG TPA: hypothetical protein VHR41_12185 [Gemmatimonadales bacterium]|jgi:hypothetical protein|nr:hypothetical protein [Gemmatimonadales bacterium]
MRWFLGPILFLSILTGCLRGPKAADPVVLDRVARRYVTLVLGLGRHDPNYVDAYYGPDSLKTLAERESLTVGQLRTAADSLIAILGDSVPAYTDSLVQMRHRYLRTQLGALSARAGMLEGKRLKFDREAVALYDARPPHLSDAHFDSLLARLDLLLPGRAPLARRYALFRDSTLIPAARVDTVFKTAIAACRARTMAHLTLPEGERFDLEYVKGTPWNAYNWYKGGYHSIIQVNQDFPIAVDRAIDLACHEGYPGHHVYNAMLERALERGRGWVELSVYPLFSPQSLIAEGSANFGIDMAFPAAERTNFERNSLFPLAGLNPALAERNAAVRVVMERLNYARNEVARRYLNGELDSAGATAAMGRYWLQSPEQAAKTLRFIETYRSYVINYNLGKDLVAAWVEREGHDSTAARWRAFGALLASPRLPGDLK